MRLDMDRGLLDVANDSPCIVGVCQTLNLLPYMDANEQLCAHAGKHELPRFPLSDSRMSQTLSVTYEKVLFHILFN